MTFPQATCKIKRGRIHFCLCLKPIKVRTSTQDHLYCRREKRYSLIPILFYWQFVFRTALHFNLQLSIYPGSNSTLRHLSWPCVVIFASYFFWRTKNFFLGLCVTKNLHNDPHRCSTFHCVHSDANSFVDTWIKQWFLTESFFGVIMLG